MATEATTGDVLTVGDSLLPLVATHDTCWAIEASSAAILLQQLRSTNAAVHVAHYEASVREAAAAAASGGDKPAKPYLMAGDIAVISIAGPMTKSPTSMSGGTSTVRARQLVRAAAKDADVKGIALRLDSPGGSVSGTADLGDDIAAAAAIKPVVAYVEDCCASAAYWVASQCSAIYANKTALVGSIGTYMVLDDASRLYKNAGVDVHVLSTGAFKGAGVEGAPITDAQIGHYQGMVNDLNAHFLGAVAAGRKMAADAVAALADGRMHIAQSAKALGLIDDVCSFDDCLNTIAAMPHSAAGEPAGKEKKAMSLKTDLKAALAKYMPGAKAKAASAGNTGAEAADPAIEESVVAIAAFADALPDDAPAAGASSVPAAAAPDPAVTAKLAAQQLEIAALQKELADQKAVAKLAADKAWISAQVESFHILPSNVDAMEKLAAENPSAFEAMKPLIEANGPVVHVAGDLKSTGRAFDAAAVAKANGSAEGGKLLAMAKEHMEKEKCSYADALKAVCSANPALAAAYYEQNKGA